MIRIADQRVVRIQQREVHAPGVHPYAGDLVKASCRFAQARLYLRPKREGIPMHVRAHLHGPVREAMHLHEFQARAVEDAGDRAPTLRAQIKSQERPRGHADQCKGKVNGGQLRHAFAHGAARRPVS